MDLEAFLSDESSPMVFLLGENGAGKSIKLWEIANICLNKQFDVLAISGTVFDKFPRRRAKNYSCLTPAFGSSYAIKAFKKALVSSAASDEYSLYKIGKILDYARFSPYIRIEVKLRRGYAALTGIQAYKTVQHLSEIPVRDRDLLAKLLDEMTIQDGPSRFNIPLYGSELFVESNYVLSFLKYEQILRKERLIQEVEIFVERDGEIFNLAHASSGELSIIAAHAFLATKISEHSVILIDEPENSLHPRWQSEYCKRLLDLFYLYQSKVIIASHSPLIVSGATANQIESKILTRPWVQFKDASARSIDGILMEAFGVLVPASHYLSEVITDLLNDLMLEKRTLEQVRSEINKYIHLSYDQKQIDFLEGALELAQKVFDESKKVKAKNESRD